MRSNLLTEVSSRAAEICTVCSPKCLSFCQTCDKAVGTIAEIKKNQVKKSLLN